MIGLQHFFSQPLKSKFAGVVQLCNWWREFENIVTPYGHPHPYRSLLCKPYTSNLSCHHDVRCDNITSPIRNSFTFLFVGGRAR